MRENKIEQKFLACAYENAQKLKQAEQDVLNLVLQPKVAWLPLKTMLCTYVYKAYEDRADLVKKNAVLKNALENPVQIHYATHIKPWNTPTSKMSHLWFYYLAQTPFFKPFMEKLTAKPEISMPNSKFYLFKKIEILKVKNGKARLFGFIPLKIKFLSC